jgi:endonuclease YncB( thermonuclease family)
LGAARPFSTLLLALTISSAQAAEWTVTGRVVAIADGDTLTVLDDAKRQHKIRLAGIDAPERRQALGDRSRRHLGKLVHEKRVEARCHKRDCYGHEVCGAECGRTKHLFRRGSGDPDNLSFLAPLLAQFMGA